MSKTSSSMLSELMTIRDILMGEIIAEYNDRFEALESELKAQKESLADKERQLDERINAVNDLLANKEGELQQLITNKTAEDREALGAMFLSVGQQLKDK